MHRRSFLLSGACALYAGTGDEQPIDLRTKDGKIAASLYSGDQWDKPFLYPIRTVSGKVISRGWPIDPREGDSTDHTWHRGFWYGHGLINKADFWREQGREKTSRLILKSKPRVQGARVTLELSMTPPGQAAIGSMRQDYHFSDSGPVRTLDSTITIRADANQPLVFGDTDDGGFAFRLTEAFREDRGARLRNSEGQTGTKQIWGKPAKWTDYSAALDGAPVGVALFDHPSNLRHPTRWHARPYGLNAANPFATKSFDKTAATDGSYTLPAGQKLTLRYRAIIYEGAPDIEHLYAQFART
jgi:hypothetical protein